MKIKHKDGLFGSKEVSTDIDDEESPYYLEYTEKPYSVNCIHNNGEKYDITHTISHKFVKNTLTEGVWVAYE